jgi:hypothetical protein
MINDIHYLRHISKGGTGNKSKFHTRALKAAFIKKIENEINQDSTPKN